MLVRVAATVVALLALLGVSRTQAETLMFAFADPVGDAWGCTSAGCGIPFSDITGPVSDVVDLTFSFDNATGDYAITVTASAAKPFSGELRVNVNLFNGTRGQLFLDNNNDFNVAVPTTSLILAGNNPQLLTWQVGDQVASCQGLGGIIPENCLGPLGSGTSFTAGIINFSTSLQSARDHFMSAPPATILTVPQFIQSLMSRLVSDVLALNVEAGISNSFDSKLNAAIAALDNANERNNNAAVNVMYAFINSVEAHRGKKVDTDSSRHVDRGGKPHHRPVAELELT